MSCLVLGFLTNLCRFGAGLSKRKRQLSATVGDMDLDSMTDGQDQLADSLRTAAGHLSAAQEMALPVDASQTDGVFWMSPKASDDRE